QAAKSIARLCLPDEPGRHAIGRALVQHLKVDGNLRRIRVWLPKFPIIEVLHVIGIIERFYDLARADRRRQELREVDASYDCIWVFRYPFAILRVLNPPAARLADIPIISA